MSPTPDPLPLRAELISFRYGPRFSLEVDAVSVGSGEVLGLIGSNGSGKTTLIRILAGFVAPDRGRIELGGEDIGTMSALRRARHLAYVPQGGRPAFEFTVEQTVLLGRMPYRRGYGSFESQEDFTAADEAIALMNLEDLRNESVTHLSGGELQRVMIARALAQQTPLLLLDEPNAHLDIGHQLSVLQTIRHVAERRRAGVIVSIHDLNLASILCDEVILLHGGRVLGAGTPAEVLRPDLLEVAFGADLVVERNVYGDAPSVRYRSTHTEGRGDD
jgi:iron complex transport system ATP-binding protein